MTRMHMFNCATWLLRSKAQLRQVLDATLGVSSSSSSRNHALLFALSSDAPELDEIVGDISESASESVGCITSPLPFHPSSASSSSRELFSCALAVVERENCIPFALENHGEGPVQVGRWHAYRKRNVRDGGIARLLERRNGGDGDWSRVWDESKDFPVLPTELQDESDVNSFVYLADNSSMNIANSFAHNYPSTTAVGMIAAPTPFINGMPFTLIRNGERQSTGVVGLALRSSQTSRSFVFSDMQSLSRPMTVLRSEGNIIHELEGGLLPARVVAEALRSAKYGEDSSNQRDLEFYVGVKKPESSEGDAPDRMFKILAGVPSRGSVAIENVLAPQRGSVIQFFCRLRSSVHLPENTLLTRVSTSNGALKNMISKNSDSEIQTIITEPEEWAADTGANDTDSSNKDGSILCAPGKFIFASEYGLISYDGPSLDLHKSGDTALVGPWKCTVPGTCGEFRYSIAK